MKTKYIQTDQTSCYDESGEIIPCSDSWQDGEFKASMLWLTPRFEAGDDP